MSVALFLDRDGTLMEDVGYPSDPADVRLIPGAAAAVRDLVRIGYVPAVVSNQSGLARGCITSAQAAAVHDRFVDLFRRESGVDLRCYYCPHGPTDGCDCRKPRPGLLWQAARFYGLTREPALMVGDKPSDVEAGIAFGAATVWLSFGRGYPAYEPHPSFIATDWAECAAILRNHLAIRNAA